MGKIIDEIHAAIAQNRRFFALEFFPPKTEAGVANLYSRMERMGGSGPLFANITWGDGGTTSDQSIEIASTAQQLLGLEMQMSITGFGASESQMKSWLSTLKERGVQNLMLLRGDPQNPVHRSNTTKKNCCGGDAKPSNVAEAGADKNEEKPFERAIDLVKFVRKEFGDHFGISVAGYPEGHAECPDYQQGLQHLKEKVDAGADLVISQMIFDAPTFLKFCQDCRQIGILCPIIPGIMPIHSYQNFRRCMVHSSGSSNDLRAGAEAIDQALHQHRNDDAEVRRIGRQTTVALIKTLFRNGVRGVYFFTMNMEAVIAEILQELSLNEGPSHRDMPWKPAADEERRKQENVRPIHWAGRAKSYLARTKEWDEFPNGRWGSTQSPAFRNEDSTYHTGSLHHAALALTSRERHCQAFSRVSSVADVCSLFLAFLNGNGVLPWSDNFSADTVSEIDLILERVLRPLNQRGFLTINSQPPVNGAKSTNKIVGWGPPGGFVYQKQYLEFFCSREDGDAIFAIFDRYPELTYMALDSKGELVQTNMSDDQGVTAVTWGVFPGREVLQPTISSSESFQTWAPEAFHLWTTPFSDNKGDIPPVINDIKQNWILVNVVDNDFVQRPTALDNAIAALCVAFPALVTGVDTPTTPTDNDSPASATSTQSPGSLGNTSKSMENKSMKRLASQASVQDLLELGVVLPPSLAASKGGQGSDAFPASPSAA